MRRTRDTLEKRKTKFQRPGRGGRAWGELPGGATLTHRFWGRPEHPPWMREPLSHWM